MIRNPSHLKHPAQTGPSILKRAATKMGVSHQLQFGAAAFLSSRFEKALLLANQLHQTQRRKGTDIPYFAHLMSVASLVLEHGGTEDEAIAGILHDAVEDQGGQKTLRLIREEFGDNVAEIVMGCTDADVIPKPPWKARKEAYIAHVATASPSVRLVSACDKLHNARAILNDYYQHGDKVWEKFKGGKEGTMWYYRSLVTEFKKHGDSPLLQELERTVSQLEAVVNKNQPSLSPKNAWQRLKKSFQTAVIKTYQWFKQSLNWLWQGCKTLWTRVWPQPKSTS